MSGGGEFTLQRGNEIVHATGTRIVIGRSASCDVTCDHSSASRHHCELTSGPGGVMLRDLGSRHGTWVDGRRVESLQVSAGSVIELGRRGMRLVVTGATYEGRSVLRPGDSGEAASLPAAPAVPQVAVPVAAYAVPPQAEISAPEPGFLRGLMWGGLCGAFFSFAALLTTDLLPLVEWLRAAIGRT